MTSDVRRESYWNATAPRSDHPTLAGEFDVDVAIIGGGIVGITTARLLKDRGLSVAVVEARRVGREVTGRAAAQISSQHGAPRYPNLQRKICEDRAPVYAQAQEAGIRPSAQLPPPPR